MKPGCGNRHLCQLALAVLDNKVESYTTQELQLTLHLLRPQLLDTISQLMSGSLNPDP